MFDLRKIFDLRKNFAVPKDFLKSKIYWIRKQSKKWIINKEISGPALGLALQKWPMSGPKKGPTSKSESRPVIESSSRKTKVWTNLSEISPIF